MVVGVAPAVSGGGRGAPERWSSSQFPNKCLLTGGRRGDKVMDQWSTMPSSVCSQGRAQPSGPRDSDGRALLPRTANGGASARPRGQALERGRCVRDSEPRSRAERLGIRMVGRRRDPSAWRRDPIRVISGRAVCRERLPRCRPFTATRVSRPPRVSARCVRARAWGRTSTWIEVWCLPYRYGLNQGGTRETINGMRLGQDAPPGPALDENSV